MKLNENSFEWLHLKETLRALGLILVRVSPQQYFVQRGDIGNPLLFFNPINRGENYSGTISVKAFNAELYTSAQITGAIRAVNSYLIEEPNS